jgi:hypothetical protein
MKQKFAASVRHTMHIVNCAKIGADVIRTAFCDLRIIETSLQILV